MPNRTSKTGGELFSQTDPESVDGSALKRMRGRTMIYRGHVKNGTIVLEDDVALPEGTPVKIEPLEVSDAANESAVPTLYERFQNVIGKVTDLPADFAEQHDHYIHGTPKK